MIRKLTESDIDHVVNLWLSASIIAHDFIPAEFWSEKVDAMKSKYLPSAESYVIASDSQVEGFISLVENSVAAIFVDPSSQGKGYGKLLLNHAKKLRASLQLSVYSKNAKSIDFYKSQGFVILREETEPETQESCYIMAWNQ